MNINKSKKILSIINIIFIFAFIGIVSVLLIVLERPVISETEKRKLNEFPEYSYESYISGEYFRGISAFFNDTVPYRDELKKLSSIIKSVSGVSYDDVEIFGHAETVTQPPVMETTISTETTEAVTTEAASETTITTETKIISETTTQTEPQNADGEISEGICVAKIDGHYRAMSFYGGGDNGDRYAEFVNRYKTDLGDDVNVYSMVIPTSGEFYMPTKYQSYNASHKKSIDNIDSKLNDVISVDAYNALSLHLKEEIYSRTDHHWLPLGAYYAAKEFTKTASTDFADLSTFKEVDVEGYLGTLYSISQSASLQSDPEIFKYFKPSNDYTAYYYTTNYTFEYNFPLFVEQPVSSSYSMFMGGDKKIVRIETDNKNGRRLAIWKDSYGNALIPFLVGSFEEIYVLDVRYFDLNAIEFMKEAKISDVLFTMCTFSAVDVNAAYIETNRTR